MRTLWIVLVVAAIAVGGSWYYKHTHPDPVPVRVVTVDRGRVEATVSNTRAGTVKACRRAKLSPVIGGQVISVPYAEGSHVHRGDVLLRLDPTDIEAEIGHIRTQIISARDQARAACLRAEYMSRTLARKRGLHPEAIAQDALDKLQTETRIAHAECEATRSAVTVAEAALTVAHKRLDHTKITAPFDGILAKVNVRAGEYITPTPPTTLSAPLIDLIAPGCYRVSVPFDEVDAGRIGVGMAAVVMFDAWRGEKYAARVTRVGDYVVDRQKQSRTVDVELELEDTNVTRKLLAGYSADATIVVEAHSDAMRIPTEALMDETHVLIFDPGEKRLRRRAITRGIGNWSFTEIKTGLEPGDKVAVSFGEKGVEAGALATIVESNATRESTP